MINATWPMYVVCLRFGVTLFDSCLFSHPDYTVGFGISPNRPPSRFADYTAGRESHPAPKKSQKIRFANLPCSNYSYWFMLAHINQNFNIFLTNFLLPFMHYSRSHTAWPAAAFHLSIIHTSNHHGIADPTSSIPPVATFPARLSSGRTESRIRFLTSSSDSVASYEYSIAAVPVTIGAAIDVPLI